MIRTVAAAVALLCTGSAAMAASPGAPDSSCQGKLTSTEAARALLEVKLQEEVERADAQTYLTRLELRVTKQRLAAALAKCGASCAPATPAPAASR